ncbi:hypothetical protein DXV76_18640 [Rhodobacteraceae bacterium CCMM004]|nr:hypothetical protein DXV76_18640 [Rhodobacteraceae bacterium CCMM004]
MRIAVLAEQNFNLIDGSTIWLLNVCKLLARQVDLDVTLILSHTLTDRVLADELPKSVRVVDADESGRLSGIGSGELTPDTLLFSLDAIEAKHGPFARIFVRGERYVEQLLGDDGWRPRLVIYAPSAIPDLAAPEPDWVAQGRAHRVPLVVQSDIAKHALESLSDYPAHVVHTVPPIVFTDGGPLPARADDRRILCYSGKIDPQYGLDWLLEFCQALDDMPGVGVSLIAGKDTYRQRHRTFFKRMDGFRASLGAGFVPGVTLVSGVPHSEAKSRMAEADFAYCLRHAHYDDVIEISTKIVEFCALGVVPIVNDTALNREFFGDDYPYLVDILTADVPAQLRGILSDPDPQALALARSRIAEIAARFSPDTLSDRLGTALRGHSLDVPALTQTQRRVLIATHERKFLRQFIDRTAADRKIDIQWQSWATTTKPAQGVALTVPAEVDTVFCEWCCENAVWHSRNKKPGTRLIVRLHRFEAFRDFPTRVEWDAVDALIVVSGHFRDMMIDRHGVDPDRIRVMPQYIDWHSLQRPKTQLAPFTVGLVGINPFEHKRFDRAVDFFAALRAHDPRFRMAVRSVMPWQIDWVWNNDVENRARFEAVFDRIASDPDLASSVRFDPAGPDMEEWYRGIGVILSSSDSEGCHTSVLEGMASGCQPVVHDWPGARSLFDPHVFADLEDAINGVIDLAYDPDADAARQAFADRVAQYDVGRFGQFFFSL